MIKSWKQNTAGLSEVYLAMTYNDIADAQMRAGNLEDASKLYQVSSDAFGRAEKCFQRGASAPGECSTVWRGQGPKEGPITLLQS